MQMQRVDDSEFEIQDNIAETSIAGEPDASFDVGVRCCYEIVSEDRQHVGLDRALVVGSSDDEGNHWPLIDIDFSAKLVPSSTEGHSHLYLEKAMSYDDYLLLIHTMHKVGLVGYGNYKALLERKEAHARLPWVRKVTPQDVADELDFEAIQENRHDSFDDSGYFA